MVKAVRHWLVSRKKASQSGAFFVVTGILCFLLPLVSTAGCHTLRHGETVKVSYVYDGDTLRLDDGRKVRLIGINTPEMGHDGLPDEPGAELARLRLEELLQASGNRIFLKLGSELQDRYRRTLAHPYDSDGRNITEVLIREGLGYAIPLPPNLSNLECYRLAERSARANRLGLWQHQDSALDVSHLSGFEEGFVHIQGEIERVGRSRRSLWLDLRVGPSIRIDWSDWSYFPGWEPDELLGRRLEARGWIYRRKGQQRLHVRHSAAIEWLDGL